MSKRQLPERQKNGEMEKRKKEKKDKKGKKQFSYIHYLYIFTNLSIIFLTHFHNLEIILVILTGRKIKRIHLQTAVDFVFIFFPSFLFDFHLQYFIQEILRKYITKHLYRNLNIFDDINTYEKNSEFKFIFVLDFIYFTNLKTSTQ